MSGGVDSSVSALLLQRAGHRIAGMFMQNWEEREATGACDADRDRLDALKICAALDIPFYARNFASEYWDRVFEHFLAEYRAGRTPNPDVMCNREIKFKTFLEHAHELGAESIATGHYARTDCVDGYYRLLRGCDTTKDQSYFLYTLGQNQLARTKFPIGELPKAQVRHIAEEAGFAVHAKKDSTGICFIGERNFPAFLSQYLPASPGEIHTPEGRVIGTHQGTMYYTYGQRNGLGIGGLRDATGEPWYVVGKDVTSNIVFAVQGTANDWLMAQRLRANELSWVAGLPPATEFACTAKTRYRQTDQACQVRVFNDSCEVYFKIPQRAVTPGQSVVFYDGDVCLGGGVITASDMPFGGWNNHA